jgi:hypothetical protein
MSELDGLGYDDNYLIDEEQEETNPINPINPSLSQPYEAERERCSHILSVLLDEIITSQASYDEPWTMHQMYQAVQAAKNMIDNGKDLQSTHRSRS